MDIKPMDEIILTIEKRALTPAEWCVGVSGDPLHSSHAHRFSWRYWRADSEPTALEIKRRLIAEGMRPDPDEATGPGRSYVYIY